MTQAFGVILSAMLAVVTSFTYMFVFVDEFNDFAPMNQADGFTPLRRHCVELVLLGMSTFLTALAIYFWIAETPDGPKLDWPKIRFFLFWLHLISGGVILVGLILAVEHGHAIHVRDGLTAMAVVVFLALSAWEFFTLNDRSSNR
jgi:hypothetical protein